MVNPAGAVDDSGEKRTIVMAFRLGDRGSQLSLRYPPAGSSHHGMRVVAATAMRPDIARYGGGRSTSLVIGEDGQRCGLGCFIKVRGAAPH